MNRDVRVFVVLSTGILVFCGALMAVAAFDSPRHCTGDVGTRVFGSMFGYVIIALMAAASAIGSGVVYVRHRARMRAILEDDPPEPAFSHSLALRAMMKDPSEIESIRGKIVKVCVMRNFAGAAGGSGGSTDVTFTSFVVDTNGVAHDLQDARAHHVVEKGALWLADQLSVPYEDVSYG